MASRLEAIAIRLVAVGILLKALPDCPRGNLAKPEKLIRLIRDNYPARCLRGFWFSSHDALMIDRQSQMNYVGQPCLGDLASHCSEPQKRESQI